MAGRSNLRVFAVISPTTTYSLEKVSTAFRFEPVIWALTLASVRHYILYRPASYFARCSNKFIQIWIHLSTRRAYPWSGLERRIIGKSFNGCCLSSESLIKCCHHESMWNVCALVLKSLGCNKVISGGGGGKGRSKWETLIVGKVHFGIPKD